MTNKYIDLAMNATGPGYKLINLEGGGAPVPPTPPEPDYSKEYLTIEALESGSFVISISPKRLSYSINEGEWIAIQTNPTNIQLQKGDKVRIKSRYPETAMVSALKNNILSFNVYGNILSLLYGDDFLGKNNTGSFQKLFIGSTGLIDASNLILPQILSTGCYREMFAGCTSLTNTPQLIATELKSECYMYMFNGCTSLTTAPELPATTLVNKCYSSMFNGCTALNYIKCLATNKTSTDNFTNSWVNGVSPRGTFVKKAGATWTRGIKGIPSGWTVIEE